MFRRLRSDLCRLPPGSVGLLQLFHSLCSLSPLSRSLGLELNAVPLLDFFGEDLVHHLMLLDDRQTLELLGYNVESIHATATTTDVLDLHRY